MTSTSPARHWVGVLNHRARETGQSKYTNLGRLLVSGADLMGVRWLIRRHGGRAGVKEL